MLFMKEPNFPSRYPSYNSVDMHIHTSNGRFLKRNGYVSNKEFSTFHLSNVDLYLTKKTNTQVDMCPDKVTLHSLIYLDKLTTAIL